MKRFCFLAASIGLLAACSGLEQPEQDLLMDDGEDLVEKIVFDVLPIKDGDDLETRASAVPNGSTVNFAWEVTDTVGIFPDKGSQAFFSMESGAGTSSANFDGGGWALKQGTSYISYYPLVGEFYLDRTKIPVSFAGQKQIGTSSPFHGARYFLATEPTSSENGVLRFSYKTLNTIINVNATLPAGTYTKASLTVSEPLFVEEGTYSLDEREIVGTKFTNTLEIELDDVVLTEEATIPVYIMSAPVDLKGKEVTVRIISSEGQHFECIKTPSKAYEAGTRYGLTCDQMVKTNVVFEDENFKAYCVENFDLDGDGEISYSEANVVTNINVDNQGISSLKGIESFTNLSKLDCSSNQLTRLDVSQNTALTELYCFRNQLTEIDVSNNVALSRLFCYSNQLSAIDLSDCSSLTNLSCEINNLTSLDLSNNPILRQVVCGHNQFTMLDMSNNPELQSLTCNINRSLTSLNLSRNSALQQLTCASCNLSNLDLSNNPQLTYLSCGANPLKHLDVSKNTNLRDLICGSTQIASIDVSNNLVLSRLTCNNNPLLSEIWLRVGQTIYWFEYDLDIATIKYKDIPEPEAVDLGLPSGVKWASYNLGATSPEEYGDYYAWGETEFKYYYNWSFYKYSSGSYNTLTKYNYRSDFGTVDNIKVLDVLDDAAHVNLGDKWHIPTDSEWTELIENCTWTWSTVDGVSGQLVTGTNGNSIFLPAAGYRSDNTLKDADYRGYYCIPSLCNDLNYMAVDDPSNSWHMNISASGFDRGVNTRYCGLSIRPVYEE